MTTQSNVFKLFPSSTESKVWSSIKWSRMHRSQFLNSWRMLDWLKTSVPVDLGWGNGIYEPEFHNTFWLSLQSVHMGACACLQLVLSSKARTEFFWDSQCGWNIVDQYPLTRVIHFWERTGSWQVTDFKRERKEVGGKKGVFFQNFYSLPHHQTAPKIN